MSMSKHVTIKTTPVKSGSVEAIGHQGDTLAVTFKGGRTYHYHGVSAAKFADLQKAESIGSFVSKQILPNHKVTKL